MCTSRPQKEEESWRGGVRGRADRREGEGKEELKGREKGREGTLSPGLFPLSMCKKKPKQEAKIKTYFSFLCSRLRMLL